ncbi:uncharacterized protein LOC62_01G001630 [Vanrija pseudolonga]|uniref:Uncharacterized protein n=1 Tax=Vanrija pseudolonga TaxID=143232 RepID=A0AAF0Y2A6_9TREE|nr:hypothetical protein LOC62_01G001630 [Vanrija pseudolonga]
MACSGKGDTCTRFNEAEKPAGSPSQAASTTKYKRNKNNAHTIKNFKARLLAHVRVLSLGSHHSCVCHTYDRRIGDLLCNVDTLRIVPQPASGYQLKPLCDGGDACLLFKHLKPRKLVLRNLDSSPYHINSWPGNLWNLGCLEEVVVVIPTNGAMSSSGAPSLTGTYFAAADRVSFIFSNKWEVWHHPAAVGPRQKSTRPTFRPSLIVEIVGSWAKHPLKTYTMFGLERVVFVADILVNSFLKYHPHLLHLSRIRQLVKNQIRSCFIETAIARGGKRSVIWKSYIKYKTVDQYAALPEVERRHELDDGLSLPSPAEGQPLATASYGWLPKYMHEAAGRALYHTVRVDKNNLAGFFLGALVGTRPEDSECKGGKCKRFADRIKPVAKVHEISSGVKKISQKSKVANFKAPLLLHVRVLSLGSHHTCVCHLYGEHVSALLTNVDTLRIVPAPKSAYKLKPLCDDSDACLLFEHLAPRKLVLRNLDDTDSYESCWPYNDKWNSSRLKEVVWVMPMEGKVYGDCGLMGTGEYFTSAANVKILCNDHWEVWHPPANAAGLNPRKTSTCTPVTPHQVVAPIRLWATFTNVNYTLFGLEAVQFKTGVDDLVRTFKRHFPTVKLDSNRLRQLVKDELRTSALEVALMEGVYEDPGYPDSIVYKTLEEYAALPESGRQYELDDGLMARFP